MKRKQKAGNKRNRRKEEEMASKKEVASKKRETENVVKNGEIEKFEILKKEA